MPYNQSPLAFGDCKRYMDEALNSDRGIKLVFDHKGQAINFRARCNSYRSKDRRANAKTFPEDHPMHGVSAWDALTFAVDDNVLVIRKIEAVEIKMETL